MLQQPQSGRGYGPGEPGRAGRGLRDHRGGGLAVRQGLGMGGLGQSVGEVVSKRLDVLMMRGGGMGDWVVKAWLPKLRMVSRDWWVVDGAVGRHLPEQGLLVHHGRRDNLSRTHLLHLFQRVLLVRVVKETVPVPVVGGNLQLSLDLPQLPPGEHLDVGADLLPRPRLARPQLDVARYQLVPPVHLPLVGKDNLPTAARRIDGERLLEALLDLGSPNPLGVRPRSLLVVVELARVVLCDLRADRF